MQRALTGRLAQTRQQLRCILLLHGACWLALGLVLSVLIFGLADWLFHASAGMRLIFLLTIVGTCGWLVFRFLLQPLLVEISDLDLALRIERLHPELGERLSSTIGFLKFAEDDPYAGSRALRHHVIESGMGAADAIDFGTLVQSAPARNVGGWTALVVALALGLAAASPTNAAIALRRLANPFTGPAWPKRTELRLVAAPEKVAKGDPFEVDVEVLGVVPDRLEIRYRYPGGDRPAPEALRPVRDNVFRGSIDTVNRPFEFSVAGGDDATQWQAVDVVPAPEVSTLHLTLAYPAYTRLGTEEYPEGRGHVRAVVGTTVTVVARSNKPLEHAELLLDDGGSVPANVGADGAQVHAQFVVRQDTNYQILLFDQEGMTNAKRTPRRYQIQAVQDAAPEVAMQKPTSDLEATASATLPLKAMIKDDFGIASVALRYSVASSLQTTGKKNPQETNVALFQGDENPKRKVIDYAWQLSPLKLSHGSVIRFYTAATDFRTEPGPNVGKSREIRIKIVSKDDFLKLMENEQQLLREELQRVLKLQENALSQVAELEKQAQIIGKFKPPEVEKLQSADMLQRRIREKIADSDQSIQNETNRLLDQLKNNQVQDVDTTKRLSMIRSELARINEQHLPPIAQSLTRATKAAKGEPSSPSEPHDNKQHPAASSQSKSAAGKAEPKNAAAKSGAAGETEKSRAATPPSPAQAKAGSPEEGQQTGNNAAQGKESDQGSQGKAGKSSKAGKSGSTSKSGANSEQLAKAESAKPPAADENADLPENLGEAKEHQQKVVDSLSQILEQLEKWETVAQVTNDARELRRRQGDIKNQTDKLAADTLGKPEDDLTPEQRAGLAKSAEKQNENAEQLGRLQRKMGRLADKNAAEDAASAETLKEALEATRKDNLAGKMADASRAIQKNRLGDAAQRQEEVNRGLDQLLDTLENRREQELARLVKKMKEAEKDLDQMRAEQRSLLQKTKEAEKIADPQKRAEELMRLRKRQEELERKTGDFAKRLSRLTAEKASLRSDRAGSRMGQAGRQMQQGNTGQAGEQQQQAEEELEQAQEELAKARQQAEDQLAQEQLARIGDAIRQIHDRQLRVKDEAQRLEGLRAAKGKWTRGELGSLASLGRSQRGLAGEAKGLTEKLTAAKVFVNVIESAVEKMNEASDWFDKRDTGVVAQSAVDAAARRFAQLLDALRPDRNQQAGGQQQQQQQGGDQQQGGGGGDGIPNIAQIKLLKLLQTELNERTTELAQLRTKAGKWTKENEKEFVDLSRRQGQLARLVNDLTAPAPEPKEEEGEKR